MEELFQHENQRLLDCSSDDEATEFFVGRSRAASQVRGVASIMGQWPGQLIPSTRACILPLCVVVFTSTTTLLLIMAISPSTPTPSLPPPRRVERCVDQQALAANSGKINIVCPVIKDADFNLNAYMKSLKQLKITFPQSEVKLIVLVNDTKISTKDNNANALNHLIFEHNSLEYTDIKTVEDKVVIDRRLLSQFVFQSPLKSWQGVSNNIMPFIIQIIAIWEHGGIAIDANMLKKEHLDKLRVEIQNAWTIFSKINVTDASHKKKLHNNIRDILEDLDSENTDTSQENLKSEETEKVETMLEAIPKKGNDSDNFNHIDELNIYRAEISKNHEVNNVVDKFKLLPKIGRTIFVPILSRKQEANDTTNYFFEFLRNLGKSAASTATDPSYDTEKEYTNLNSDIIIPNKNFTRQRRNSTHENANLKIRDSFNKVDLEPEKTLVVDMKGYLIASRSYCHAFIGEIFSTVKKYPKLFTPMELIDKTWNIFCHSNAYTNCSEIVFLS